MCDTSNVLYALDHLHHHHQKCQRLRCRSSSDLWSQRLSTYSTMNSEVRHAYIKHVAHTTA